MKWSKVEIQELVESIPVRVQDNIVPLGRTGWLKDVEFDEHTRTLRIKLTAPDDSSINTGELSGQVKSYIQQHLPENIKLIISVSHSRQSPRKRATPAAQTSSKLSIPAKHVIAIASGKGGVGKSTISVLLAWYLKNKSGKSTALLDADLHGPSIPELLNLKDVTLKTRKEPDQPKPLILPVEWEGIHVMSLGFFIDPGQPVLWRGPIASGTVRQLVNDVYWEPVDFFIIDLPPGTGDIPMTVAQAFPLTGAVVVTVPNPVAWADVHRAINMFRHPSLNVPVTGVVVNMSYLVLEDDSGRKYYPFGRYDIGGRLKDMGVPLIGELPLVAFSDPSKATYPDLIFHMLEHRSVISALHSIANAIVELHSSVSHE